MKKAKNYRNCYTINDQQINSGLFVNCSGLMKSYNLERTKLVLSFLMFKAMRILATWRGPIGFLLFDVQNNENSNFKVVKFPEAKSISLDVFDEVSGSL